MSNKIEVRVELVIESLDRSKLLVWKKKSVPGVTSLPSITITESRSAIEYAVLLLRKYLKSKPNLESKLHFVGVVENQVDSTYVCSLVFKIDFEDLGIDAYGTNSLCTYGLVNLWDLPSGELDVVTKSTLSLLHITDRTKFLPFLLEDNYESNKK